MWKHWLLRIGLSPLLHRSCKPAVQIQYHSGYMWDIMTRPAVNRQGILWSTCVQDKTTFGWLPPWLLTLSRQGICCLNSVQDLQNYDLYKCFSPSSSLKLVSQKGYQLLIFSRAIGHRVTKILAYSECALSHHRPKSRHVFKLRIYLSTDEVFKSLIAKTGWIFMMILNDWGFHTGLYYSNLE